MNANPTRRRWLFYLLVGLVFGVIDWYYLNILATLLMRLAENLPIADSSAVRIVVILGFNALNYGIWLVPVIPAAIYEYRRSRSIRRAALAAVLIWVAAILSYYFFYTLLLLFVGLPNLDFMLFSNRSDPAYWQDFWPPFRRIILVQILEWIGIAVIGGALIGALTAIIYNQIASRTRRRIPPKSV